MKDFAVLKNVGTATLQVVIVYFRYIHTTLGTFLFKYMCHLFISCTPGLLVQLSFDIYVYARV